MTYSKYNAVLKEECGIDFEKYIADFNASGNSHGIYHDVGLLLYKLIASPEVNSVIEFGSGLSTCVMAKAAEEHGKKFMAMEHTQPWYGVTRKCLDVLNLSAEGFVLTDSIEENFSVHRGPIELAWVDGPIADDRGTPGGLVVGRTESCDWYAAQLKDAVLLFDDVQVTEMTYPWVESFGRSLDDTILYNPVGRTDRHVLVSFPGPNHPLKAVVEACIAVQTL